MRRLLVILFVLLIAGHTYSWNVFTKQEVIQEFHTTQRFNEMKILWRLSLQKGEGISDQKLKKQAETIFFSYYTDNPGVEISTLELRWYELILHRLGVTGSALEGPDIPADLIYQEVLVKELEGDLLQLKEARENEDSVRWVTALSELQTRVYMIMVLQTLRTGNVPYTPALGIYKDQQISQGNVDALSRIWIDAYLKAQVEYSAKLYPLLEGWLLEEQKKIYARVRESIASLPQLKQACYKLMAELEYMVD